MRLWHSRTCATLTVDRRAVDQHDLVAPVELVGLARRKAQRHIGFRRRRTALGAPLLGVAPYRVVAALVAEPAQLLEDPDQRQPLARRLALVRQQQPVELFAPRIDPRQRLPAALIRETRSPATGSPCAPTFRDTRNSRQIALIGLSWAKYARRIFAIVSTTSIPRPPSSQSIWAA